MTLPFSKPGLSRLIFLALVLVFNWPLLSIPTGNALLYWLFSAWALAIAILFAMARRTASTPAASMTAESSAEPPAAAGLAGPADLGQAAGPGAGGGASDMSGASGAAGQEDRDV